MGWVGLGFSDNGGMAGSDIVIGGVFPNGSQYFKDRYATGNTLPLVDPQQDYTLLSLSERDGKTVMAFNRSIGACDSRDFPITTLPIKLIYAYGLNDEITHHSGRRGTKEISLLGYVPRSTPTTTNHFDITANNFTVPPVHTYYYCRIIKAPNLGRKNHIYQIEPIVDHVDLTHHMLLYGCSASVNQTLEGMCYSNNMSPFNFCFKVIAAWGIGGGSFYLPPNTGISIGGTNDPAYYRLEMHYNNPSQAQGQVDNSGLRFHYTPELFDHDVGTLHIGLDLIPEYMLPPDTQSFRSYAVCNTSIFSKVLPGSFPDMNVFAVLLHTHLAGRKMRVAQFRNGEQIGFLGVNENYDFNLQEFKYLGQTAIIKEGDEMVVECTYNTKNRSKVTNLGLSTTEEMCYAFLLYYPATDISFCWSVPNMTQVGASLQATNKV
ncbi:MOXD2 protein, partial [Amia calva]|nr:MOXD2 protein [Amia calva]